MNLSEKPETTIWPETHYIFIEKTGPFQQTAPAAWQEFHQKAGALLIGKDFYSITALYKLKPEMLYRAGVMLKAKPAQLPAGMKYEKFAGGKYAKFTLVGSYAQLPEACAKVFSNVEQMNMKVRDDFFLENYANDPKVTPEDKLITEIMIPAP